MDGDEDMRRVLRNILRGEDDPGRGMKPKDACIALENLMNLGIIEEQTYQAIVKTTRYILTEKGTEVMLEGRLIE